MSIPKSVMNELFGEAFGQVFGEDDQPAKRNRRRRSTASEMDAWRDALMKITEEIKPATVRQVFINAYSVTLSRKPSRATNAWPLPWLNFGSQAACLTSGWPTQPDGSGGRDPTTH